MDEGKVPLTKLKELLKYKGQKNEGIVLAGRLGLDVAVLDMKTAKTISQKYYDTDSEVFIVEKSDPITFPTSEPGRYAVIINANDIACSGALPFGFLSTIIAPVKSSFEDILQVQKQIDQQCLELGISILGGHTEISKSVNSIIVSGHMVGFVPIDYMVPNKLTMGECILIVGFVGSEGTGIIISEADSLVKEILNEKEIQDGIKIGSQLEVTKIALKINRKFQPSLIHDITEGGMYGALAEIIADRDIGIKIENDPPISPITLTLSSWLDINPRHLISSGALVIGAKENIANQIVEYMSDLNLPCSIIGRVTNESGVLKKKDKILGKPKGDEIIKALSNLRKMRNGKL